MTASRHKRPHRNDRLLGAERLSVENGVTADHLCGPVDRIAADMELKWGIDRLPDLVPLDLAERFGAQVEKFNRAAMAIPVDLDELRTQAQRMINAYRALDRAAEQASAPKANPEVWEIEVDGKRCAVVRDAAMVPVYRAQGGTGRVYSLDEIARILALDSMRLVSAAKNTFDGATVKAVVPRKSEFAEMLDDEIPF